MKQVFFWVLLVMVISVQGVAQKNNPFIIAHRGASAHAPENTLSAFKKAITLGVDYLELDLRQTKDSQLVILHDASIKRTTNGKGNVEDLTLSQIKSHDAGSWFSNQFRGETVPTFEEILTILDSSTSLIIEIKENSVVYPGIEKRVVDVIKRHHLEERVIVKSFEKEVLQTVRELAPELPLLYVYVFKVPFLDITIDHWLSFGDILDLDVEYLQPHKIFLTEAFIKEAHQKGKKVIAWGVDSEPAMREMKDMGVDGIETDSPELSNRVFNNVGGNVIKQSLE